MMDSLSSVEITLETDAPAPSFDDLPWDLPLEQWQGHCERLVEIPVGLSRHPVVFVNYDGKLYSLKELSVCEALREHALLIKMAALRLPVVSALGYATFKDPERPTSVLITRWLERSLPYRTLFMGSGLERYRQHLLDAMAWLLVQLHLAGIFWGDCSLSNTLFRRDAGMLQAYLVDAETSETHTPRLEPALRYQDLEIMEVNVRGDLEDLAAAGYLTPEFSARDTGIYIRQRYRDLWEEVTREEMISPGESYKIQERIRALNNLGFTVEDVEIPVASDGAEESVRLRIAVTERSFHRDYLSELTGLEVEEMQARKLMNEINEQRAVLSRERNQSIPLSAAAYFWQQNIYTPVVESLQPLIEQRKQNPGGIKPGEETITDPVELYCEVLEHKWYLSERAQHDVGHLTAVADYIKTVAGGS